MKKSSRGTYQGRSTDVNGYPTEGKYADGRYWPEVIEAAGKRPELAELVRVWEITRHPSALNSIMDQADADLSEIFKTGRPADKPVEKPRWKRSKPES